MQRNICSLFSNSIFPVVSCIQELAKIGGSISVKPWQALWHIQLRKSKPSNGLGQACLSELPQQSKEAVLKPHHCSPPLGPVAGTSLFMGSPKLPPSVKKQNNCCFLRTATAALGCSWAHQPVVFLVRPLCDF